MRMQRYLFFYYCKILYLFF